MIKKNQIKNLLLSYYPLFVTIVIFCVIVIVHPFNIQKYEVRLKDELRVNDNSFYTFSDLTGDGFSEKIRFLCVEDKNLTGILVYKDNRILNQWNFQGISNMKKVSFLIGDYDNNDYKEIILFTYHNDSIYLNIIEPFEDGIIGQQRAVDAIEKSKYILEQIDRLNKDWKKRKTHPLLPIPCQVIPAQINGGDYPTTYANNIEIVFNAQYLPEEKDDKGAGSKVKKEIEDFVEQVASTDKWLAKNQPEIEWILDANCGETPVSNDFVQKLLKHNKMIIKPEGINTGLIEGVTSHTDMGFFTERGINMINYGPGQPFSAHQPNEYVSIDELIIATKVIARAIIDWTGIR